MTSFGKSAQGRRKRLNTSFISTPGPTPKTLVQPITLMPRYWPILWEKKRSAKSPKTSTTQRHLYHIGKLYLYCDQHFGVNALDAAISALDIDRLYSMIEAFHLALLDGERSTATSKCWKSIWLFISEILREVLQYDGTANAVTRYLEANRCISAPVKEGIRYGRALPSTTLKDLLEVADPDSVRNPYTRIEIRRRNWFIMQLFLRAGLRRGEELLLKVDSLSHDLDHETGEVIYWINVTEVLPIDQQGNINEFYEEDVRHTRPSIKTDASHRQIPVDQELARLWEAYIEYRPRGKTNYLFTADGNRGLSAESITKMLQKFTTCISKDARTQYKSRTNGKRYISSHDFRHTCATVFFKNQMKAGADRDVAYQRMRAFFGWEKESEMPGHYAHAAIQDDLHDSWASTFQSQVELLRKYHARG